MPDSNILVLEILKQESHLSMSIFEQRDLASTLRHYSACSMPYQQVQKLCTEITALLNKVNNRGSLEPELIQALKKSGQLLWDGLLTHSVKNRLKTSQVLDLLLSIDEELIEIPWELLYDGKEFLCLKFNLGRVVRTKEKINPPQYRSLSTSLKMLVLANPTNDLKSAYLEGVNIKNQFDHKRSAISIDFKSTHIDILYLKKNLRDYDIVHFAGHCEYDLANPKNSGWVLSDGKFTAEDILVMSQTLSLPSLVFSNACYSACVKDEFSISNDYQQKTYSLASAFLFSGVRHYIGAILKIEDPVSLDFAREFYAQLVKGKSLGECIRLARRKLIEEHGVGCIYWASYILYGNPNYTFFRLKAKAAQDKAKREPAFYKKLALKAGVLASIIFIGIYLYCWLPSINPNTYFLFLKSKELFLKGKNEQVIANCSQIIKNEPLFLAAYPLLADTYYRRGDATAALKYYFEYIRTSEKKQDKKSLSAAYIGIGWIYLLQGEYPKAFDFCNKAITTSREVKDKLGEARAMERLAVWYIDKKDNDKALELLMKSSEINRQRQNIWEHRYGLACDYFDIALVFANKGDFGAALDFYAKSRQLFEKLKLKYELSDYYFNLGEINLFEKKYQQALECYMKGLNIDQEQGNLRNFVSDYDMIGQLYVEMDNPQEAERYFQQSIMVGKQIEAPLDLASAAHNLGLLYKNTGQKNKAREYLRQAQEIYWQLDAAEYQQIKKELQELNGSF